MTRLLCDYVILMTLIAISCLSLSDCSTDECNLEMLSFTEPSDGPFFKLGYRLQFNYRFMSLCRPQIALERKNENDEYISLNWFRVHKDLTFFTPISSESENSYSATLIIDPFSTLYQGQYRYVISDSTGNKLVKQFVINAIIREDPDPACFLPHAKNITAIALPLSANENTQNVYLNWQTTAKENPSLSYCQGTRRWQVRVLAFSNVESAPGDYHVTDDSSADWVTVPRRDTNYTFTEISLNMYYSFQVGHIEKKFDKNDEIQPLVFASQVYFFGQQYPPNIRKPPDSVIRLYVGSSRSVHCDASGFPLPDVKWIRESGSPPTVRRNNSAILELNHVTKEHAGIYYCIAFNILVNPPKGRRDESDTWKITVIIEDYAVSETGLSCRSLPLDSSICKNYIYTGLKIFTNHSTNESSIEREDRAIALTLDINQDIPLGTCRDLAYSMMCHNVYPYCDAAPGKPTSRKLCKSVCQEFVSGQCKGYLSKSSPLYAMLAEGCDSRNYTGGESPECIPLSYETHRNGQFELIEDTGDCIRGDGRGYSGSSYRTESGAVCQSWEEQTPHPHPMLPDLYRSDLDQAHFSCRNPGGIGKRPWCYTDDPIIRWEYCSIPQCDSCEVYHGTTCQSLEGYVDGRIAVRRTRHLQSQDAIEEKISLFSKSVLRLEPSEGCKDILRVLLCHGAFPQCTETSTKQLCSVHCQFNQTLKDLCPDVFMEFSQFVASNRHFMNGLDCAQEGGDQCMAVVTMTEPAGNAQDSMKDQCYDRSGLTYNGTVSTTINGVQCQAWDSQEPHTHSITPARYPELQNSKNYCRNPGNLQGKPWCYTTSSDVVWDYCDVPHCDTLFEDTIKGESNSEKSSSNGSPQAKESTAGPIVATMSVLVTILLVLMGVAFTGCYCFLSRKNKRAKAILETEFRLSKMTREAFEGEKYVTNKDYTKVPATNRSQSLVIPENFTLLDSKDIKYVSQLGQGNFGIVFKGKAFGIKQFGDGEEDEGIDVAVKTLKEEATSEVKQDFIDEAKLMFTFDHPNILKIHGVCMNEMPYQLVFEYMDEGDLTKFLRSRASSQQRRLINPFSYRSRTESSYSDDPASLSKTELLYICKQISAGMKYLAENKHVHRDLACRNCLIKSDLVVKIGDFGMSRNLYSKDYYRINGNAVLPVRWMSPESLIYGKFSIEGDVWSFGVVMWEVFSFALQPYYGITNEEVTEAIRKGKTLGRPDECPIEVYRLMKECWAMDPADRITFPELCDSLSALHQMASLCGSSIGEKFTDDEDDAFSDSSDMPSDAFYSEEHLDNISNELEQHL